MLTGSSASIIYRLVDIIDTNTPKYFKFAWDIPYTGTNTIGVAFSSNYEGLKATETLKN